MAYRARLLVPLAAALAACSRGGYEAPPLSDEPAVAAARLGSIELTAPAYGVSMAPGGDARFEVNVEAEDAPSVKAGQACRVYVPPSPTAAACTVARVLRSASAETGQAVAWLAPRFSNQVGPGEFVFAQITTGVKKGVLVAPSAAVLTKGGKTWVVRRAAAAEGAPRFEAVEVKTGEAASGLVEIVSGLSDGDEVAVTGALGYLYPEFKAGSGDR